MISVSCRLQLFKKQIGPDGLTELADTIRDVADWLADAPEGVSIYEGEGKVFEGNSGKKAEFDTDFNTMPKPFEAACNAFEARVNEVMMTFNHGGITRVLWWFNSGDWIERVTIIGISAGNRWPIGCIKFMRRSGDAETENEKYDFECIFGDVDDSSSPRTYENARQVHEFNHVINLFVKELMSTPTNTTWEAPVEQNFSVPEPAAEEVLEPEHIGEASDMIKLHPQLVELADFALECGEHRGLTVERRDMSQFACDIVFTNEFDVPKTIKMAIYDIYTDGYVVDVEAPFYRIGSKLRGDLRSGVNASHIKSELKAQIKADIAEIVSPTQSYFEHRRDWVNATVQKLGMKCKGLGLVGESDDSDTFQFWACHMLMTMRIDIGFEQVMRDTVSITCGPVTFVSKPLDANEMVAFLTGVLPGDEVADEAVIVALLRCAASTIGHKFHVVAPGIDYIQDYAVSLTFDYLGRCEWVSGANHAVIVDCDYRRSPYLLRTGNQNEDQAAAAAEATWVEELPVPDAQETHQAQPEPDATETTTLSAEAGNDIVADAGDTLPVAGVDRCDVPAHDGLRHPIGDISAAVDIQIEIFREKARKYPQMTERQVVTQLRAWGYQLQNWIAVGDAAKIEGVETKTIICAIENYRAAAFVQGGKRYVFAPNGRVLYARDSNTHQPTKAVEPAVKVRKKVAPSRPVKTVAPPEGNVDPHAGIPWASIGESYEQCMAKAETYMREQITAGKPVNLAALVQRLGLVRSDVTKRYFALKDEHEAKRGSSVV